MVSAGALDVVILCAFHLSPHHSSYPLSADAFLRLRLLFYMTSFLVIFALLEPKMARDGEEKSSLMNRSLPVDNSSLLAHTCMIASFHFPTAFHF